MLHIGRSEISRFWRYLLLGILFWVVVDFTTAFNPDFGRWLRHMPLIWVFYIGYPAMFAFLIYRLNWRGRKLAAAAAFSALGLEIIVFRNTLLYTFPVMLIMIPAALVIYSLITFVPMWMVEKELARNWRWVALFGSVWLIVAFLSYQNSVTPKF